MFNLEMLLAVRVHVMAVQVCGEHGPWMLDDMLLIVLISDLEIV